MEVLIVGEGRPVYFLSQQFSEKGYNMHVVTPRQDEAHVLSERTRATVLVGDGTELAVQEQAGARRADVFIALLERDEDNLIACQVAQRVFGVPYTLALVHDPEHEPIFQQLGISGTVSVTHIISLMIEEQIGVGEVANLVTLAKGRVTITELVLPHDALALNRSLSELRLPENSLVATIIRDDDVIIPSGSTVFKPLDRILLVTQPDTHDKTVAAFTATDA